MNNKFVLDVLNGKITITESVKKSFEVKLLELLENGYYIGSRQGEIVISNKFPEKNLKQRADYENLIKNIFIQA